MEITPDIQERLNELKKKYDLMGQDIQSYLDGLLMSNYLPYWDYINLDVLLNLQQPKTDFPDEEIFIVYHQITELYFKLSLHEIDQIAHNGRDVLATGEDLGWKDKLDVKLFTERLTRINKYFEALTKSFEIMINGMEKEQFLRFRMALLPASGFQSSQYRMIEISSTDLINIVQKDHRGRFTANPTDEQVKEMMEYLYWKKGATDLVSGKKTLTLRQFEEKYMDQFTNLALKYKDKNLWRKYKQLSEEDQQNTDLKLALRQLDVNVNINWPLVHYKSAVRYLQQDPSDVAATGGTNWQKYLPPRFQKRIFYPELWSEEEKENWGKKWVESVVFQNM